MPEAGIPGDELTSIANPHHGPGRRTTIIKGANAAPIDPNKRYRAEDLVDHRGNQVKFGDMPDRTKGGWLGELLNALFGQGQESPQPRAGQYSRSGPPVTPVRHESGGSPRYWGDRTALSKRIILEQCEDIARNRFAGDVQIDREGAHTFVVNNFTLPTKWHRIPGVVRGKSPLAIVFPTDYPKLAPVGVYLKATISDSPNGHFYTQAYHDADKEMLKYGWKWYCVFVKEGHWRPARYREPLDWRRGDNIWTYFDLIKEAFSTND